MGASLGGRWTFLHRIGNAMVETVEYPEAAVAYQEAHLMQLCEATGFQDITLVGGPEQSLLECRK
jgi:hypothetical protein